MNFLLAPISDSPAKKRNASAFFCLGNEKSQVGDRPGLFLRTYQLVNFLVRLLNSARYFLQALVNFALMNIPDGDGVGPPFLTLTSSV